jgi:mannosyl-oligosaccharide glucosidase
LYKKHNTAHDPPYWRGQIWININYLSLQALEYYKNLEGPHAETARQAYAGLRQAILSNIEAQYTGRGYLFEQYDDSTGQGMSSHPFTGWTALVALVAAG